MREDDKDYAISFALPSDAQGITYIMGRQSCHTRQLDGMEGDWVRIADRRGRLLAIGSVVERLGGSGMVVIQPKIVFPAPALSLIHISEPTRPY